MSNLFCAMYDLELRKISHKVTKDITEIKELKAYAKLAQIDFVDLKVLLLEIWTVFSVLFK